MLRVGPNIGRDAYWEQPPAKVQKDAFGGKGAWGKGKDSEFWGPGPVSEALQVASIPGPTAVPGAKGGRDVPAVALVGAGSFPAASPIPGPSMGAIPGPGPSLVGKGGWESWEDPSMAGGPPPAVTLAQW